MATAEVVIVGKSPSREPASPWTGGGRTDGGGTGRAMLSAGVGTAALKNDAARAGAF
mgnify:CR=1 FL=1